MSGFRGKIWGIELPVSQSRSVKIAWIKRVCFVQQLLHVSSAVIVGIRVSQSGSRLLFKPIWESVMVGIVALFKAVLKRHWAALRAVIIGVRAPSQSGAVGGQCQ